METIEFMIRLYCTKHEGNKELCPKCCELLDYAITKLKDCKYGEKKSSCKHCKTHCYKPIMREQIRKVMRFSGPRMIVYAPIEAIRHYFAIFPR